MEKYYFKDEDAERAYPLEYHIEEAREDGLSDITLFEAIPDNDNPEYIYCAAVGEVGERSECRKRICPDYESKSGRGVCKYRGKLCTHGDKVTFKID